MSKLSAVCKYRSGSLETLETFSVQWKWFINSRYGSYTQNNVRRLLLDIFVRNMINDGYLKL